MIENKSSSSEEINLTLEAYHNNYRQSIDEPEQFWSLQAKEHIIWSKTWNTVCQGSMKNGDVRWFEGGQLNACYNCLDRHAINTPEKIAILWQGENLTQTKTLTYAELTSETARFAKCLQDLDVCPGDRVCIYMPMIPEAIIAMMACARIGAVHSVVFAGFSAEALRSRILDAQCKIIITADFSQRGGKLIPLKQQVDQALAESSPVEKVVVVKHVGQTVPWNPSRDHDYQELLLQSEEKTDCLAMDSEAPLFILYTSGSTGKPKGVLHTTAGYLLYNNLSFKTIFQPSEQDIYWCTADIGWITGHSYIVYGPLSQGTTLFIYEGIPNYPSSQRCWELIEKHKITIFYSAPTLIRALLREGDNSLKNYNRSSLRLLGSVGEPINPEVWQWYFDVVGEGRCPIVDTWWQTETGGIALTSIPHIHTSKPGVAGLPFYGIKPAILNEQNQAIQDTGEGKLVITQTWPAQLRTLYGNHQRFLDTYFISETGYYFTGDGAERDEQGYYRIIGRIDDVINTSGHRLGTAEVESALLLYPMIAEAAVIGYPHDLKGEAICAFVLLKQNVTVCDSMLIDVNTIIKKQIGAIAKVERLVIVNNLPKTRSGKIMRRILRKIMEGHLDELGDVSTLADPQALYDVLNPIRVFGF